LEASKAPTKLTTSQQSNPACETQNLSQTGIGYDQDPKKGAKQKHNPGPWVVNSSTQRFAYYCSDHSS
tara:strand:- start:73 stop:276 length:204 start_codon:yes stop_codon:yes gene_type:complete